MYNILNLIYPPACGICGKIDSYFLCKKCELILKEQAKFEDELNQDINKYYNRHLYIFEYSGIIRKLLIDYKFNEKSYLYKTFSIFLLKNTKFFKLLKSYDTIIPVPISNKRKKERGYNQSFLIAKSISKKLKVENNTDLIKNKDIVEQSKLNKKQREQNIKGVYSLKNIKNLNKKKIILLDDIYTTGNTVNECCKVLQQAKPAEISILTLAKD